MLARPLPAGSGALLVTELFPPSVGGTPVLFESIYSRLRAIDTMVLTHGDRADARPGSGSVCRIVRQPMATTRWGVRDWRGLWRHLGLACDIGIASARRDVVHVARALPEGVAAWMWRRVGGAPYICWAHGEDIASALQSREFTFMVRRVYRGAGAVIANSLNTRRMLEALDLPAERLHVVHPGVDAERFHPGIDGRAMRRRFAPQGEVLLLSVGRLQRRKGHDLALAAVDRVREVLPHLRYLIVGDGHERRRLEDQMRARGLEDYVTFLGEVDASELPAYYAACDLFLHPNRIDGHDVEGFGMVFLEAAASGKPSIGGANGGVPEAVEDGVTGLLVSGADAEELARAVVALASNPERRRRMGDAARVRVLREFTWDRAAGAVSAIHHRLARSSS